MNLHNDTQQKILEENRGKMSNHLSVSLTFIERVSYGDYSSHLDLRTGDRSRSDKCSDSTSVSVIEKIKKVVGVIRLQER